MKYTFLLTSLFISVLAAVAAIAQAQQKQPQQLNTKWEYQTSNCNVSSMDWNRLGDQGWELVAVTPYSFAGSFSYQSSPAQAGVGYGKGTFRLDADSGPQTAGNGCFGTFKRPKK